MAKLLVRGGVLIPFDKPTPASTKRQLKSVGRLLSPIVPRSESGLGVAEHLRVADQLSGENLDRIAIHFGLDGLDKVAKWKTVARILAQMHFPNCFTVREKFPQGQRASGARNALLVAEMEKRMPHKGERGAASAIAGSVREFKGKNPDSLRRQYQRLKKVATSSP